MAVDARSEKDDQEGGRARWMAVLARARCGELEPVLRGPDLPRYQVLRGPETGLVMVRGRSGGTGRPFNFGEATVTRCVVRLEDGTTGHCYALGRDKRKAELAAYADALLRTGDGPRLAEVLVEPIAARLAADRQAASRKAAATKVEFFTMVRGDNPK